MIVNLPLFFIDERFIRFSDLDQFFRALPAMGYIRMILFDDLTVGFFDSIDIRPSAHTQDDVIIFRHCIPPLIWIQVGKQLPKKGPKSIDARSQKNLRKKDFSVKEVC